ncbi:MAG: hypothetical protein GEV12_06445 [Micromonosporaceae bacterium]|nr:hypothetical protein [Micromonosporaceae bacterium]
MRRLLTPGWLAGHTLMVAAVATMLALGWWQLTRATGGNGLSWGYAFQWPVFAGFVVFMWAREVRRARRGEEPEPGRTAASAPASVRAAVLTRGAAGPAEAAYDDSDDPELAAYNRYLAWLSANPGARPVDYPG